MAPDPRVNATIADIFKRLGVENYPSQVRGDAHFEFSKLTLGELTTFRDTLALKPPSDPKAYADNVVHAAQLTRPDYLERSGLSSLFGGQNADDSAINYVTTAMAKLANSPDANMGVINARQALDNTGGSGSFSFASDSGYYANNAAPAASGEYEIKQGIKPPPRFDQAVQAMRLPKEISDALLKSQADNKAGFNNPIDFANGLYTAAQEAAQNIADAHKGGRYERQQILGTIDTAVDTIVKNNPGDLNWITVSKALKQYPDGQMSANGFSMPTYGSGVDPGGDSIGQAVSTYQAYEAQPLVQLIKHANTGDTQAQLALGDAYLRGNTALGVKADTAQGLHWLTEAAKSKDKGVAAVANHEIGIHYEYGIVDKSGKTQPDYPNAVKAYTEAANRGNVHSMERLGGISLGEKNPGDAVKWYQQAAQLGNVEAQFQLSHLLYMGHGAKMDQAAAYKWSLIAAKNHDKRAAADLGGHAYDHLKPQEKAQAQQLADAFKATFDPKANPELVKPNPAPAKPVAGATTKTQVVAGGSTATTSTSPKTANGVGGAPAVANGASGNGVHSPDHSHVASTDGSHNGATGAHDGNHERGDHHRRHAADGTRNPTSGNTTEKLDGVAKIIKEQDERIAQTQSDARTYAQDRAVYAKDIDAYNAKYGTSAKPVDPAKPDPSLKRDDWAKQEKDWRDKYGSPDKASQTITSQQPTAAQTATPTSAGQTATPISTPQTVYRGVPDFVSFEHNPEMANKIFPGSVPVRDLDRARRAHGGAQMKHENSRSGDQPPAASSNADAQVAAGGGNVTNTKNRIMSNFVKV